MLPKLLHGYQMDRITIWLNPGSDAQGKGYNIIQSLIAFCLRREFLEQDMAVLFKNLHIYRNVIPTLFLQSLQKFGFLGCLFIICLFIALVLRGIRIAKRCPDMYGKLLALGITIIFGFQAFLNMSVTQVHSYCNRCNFTIHKLRRNINYCIFSNGWNSIKYFKTEN